MCIRDRNKEKSTGEQQWKERTRIQINDLEHTEEINIQPEQKEETRFQKSEDRLRNIWDNIKHTNVWIITVPEGGEEQETENLFEQVMEENFPNLVKQIDMQVQEAQRVPNKMGAKRPTSRHIIIKMLKVKDKERILKAAREKHFVTLVSSHKTVSWFFKRNFAG